MMKSCWIRSAPGGALLETREAPLPEPETGQARVRVRAAALNRGEFVAGGLHTGALFQPAGFEMAGEVEVATPGGRFAVGAAVMGACRGAFAEAVCVDEGQLMPLPQSLSWAEGATIPVCFLTAHDALCGQGRLRRGERLLIAGAGSGVGVAALQLGKALGALTIGTSGDDGKLARLRTLGLDVAVQTRGPGIAQAVHQATDGHGADLALNIIGGSAFDECLRALAFEGRLAIVGYVDERHTAGVDLALVHRQRLAIFGLSAQLRTPAQRRAAVKTFESDVLPFFDKGSIRPSIEAVYPFDKLDLAKRCMESNAHLGKLAITF